MFGRTVAAVALLALVEVTPGSAAAGCPESARDLTTTRGTLARTATCGAWVLATDATALRFSYGEVSTSQPVTIPYELSVTVRRLSSDSDRPLEIRFFGGWFMLKDGAFGLYVSETQFAAEGWHERPGLDTHREHTLVLRQRTGQVTVSLDGEQLGAWVVTNVPTRGSPGIGLKGAGGYRARMRFRDLRLRALE